MQFTTSQKHAFAWLAMATLAVLALWFLGPVLTPFVVAAVLAYALTPLVDRLDALAGGRMPRFLAVILVELLLMLALVLLVLLVVPIVAKEVPLMREQAPLVFDRLNLALAPWLVQLGIPIALDLASLKVRLLEYLNANYQGALGSLLSSLKLGGSVALTVVGNAVLIPVALFYLLLDWKPFVARLLELVPPRARPGFDSFTGEADLVLGQYLRGQLLVMLTMGVFYSSGLALVAGFLQFASVKALVMVAAVYGSGQVIEGFYLTPRLVGERIGLHPLLVIFALLAFGQLFGFVGVLVALPASAVLLVAMRRMRTGYIRSELYQS